MRSQPGHQCSFITSAIQTNGSRIHAMGSESLITMRKQSAALSCEHRGCLRWRWAAENTGYSMIPVLCAPWPSSSGCGLDQQERARVPKAQDGKLPTGCVYVGRGHRSHRLPLSDWCSPNTPGHDCAAEEGLPCYVEYISRTDPALRLPP